MESQEYLMKLQVLEQEANHLGEQAKLVDQQIDELNSLNINILKLEKSEEDEIFSEIGKGIYVKGMLKKADLLAEVGSKIFVQKSNKEVKQIIENQIKSMNSVKNQIANKINEINGELNNIISSVKSGKSKESNKVKK